MSEGLVQAAYILAALLFIMSLAGLSKHETAKAGCWFGIVGMTNCSYRNHFLALILKEHFGLLLQ